MLAALWLKQEAQSPTQFWGDPSLPPSAWSYNTAICHRKVWTSPPLLCWLLSEKEVEEVEDFVTVKLSFHSKEKNSRFQCCDAVEEQGHWSHKAESRFWFWPSFALWAWARRFVFWGKSHLKHRGLDCILPVKYLCQIIKYEPKHSTGSHRQFPGRTRGGTCPMAPQGYSLQHPKCERFSGWVTPFLQQMIGGGEGTLSIGDWRDLPTRCNMWIDFDSNSNKPTVKLHLWENLRYLNSVWTLDDSKELSLSLEVMLVLQLC